MLGTGFWLRKVVIRNTMNCYFEYGKHIWLKLIRPKNTNSVFGIGSLGQNENTPDFQIPNLYDYIIQKWNKFGY